MQVSKEIESLIPYQAGKPIDETKREYGIDTVYKLASNENPLGPSPKAKEAILSHLDHLHRYPDASCYELVQFLSKKEEVEPDSFVITNGSNEAIDLLIRVFCQKGDQILTSQYAFIAYKICAQAAGVACTEVPTKNYKIDLSSFKKHWTPKHKLIFLPNPNNPTGTYFSKEEWVDFLQFFGNKEDVLVILDEAYVEFVRANDYPNGKEFFGKYKNLILSRTLSKVYGLAGLRVGYLMGDKKLMNYIHRVRNPFNVNSLAQVAAIAALQDEDYIKKSQNLVWSSLDYFYSEMDRLNIPYLKSQANFVLFEVGEKAKEMTEALLKKGVILRPVAAYGLTKHLRLSVGLQDENEIAMKSIENFMGNKG